MSILVIYSLHVACLQPCCHLGNALGIQNYNFAKMPRNLARLAETERDRGFIGPNKTARRVRVVAPKDGGKIYYFEINERLDDIELLILDETLEICAMDRTPFLGTFPLKKKKDNPRHVFIENSYPRLMCTVILSATCRNKMHICVRGPKSDFPSVSISRGWKRDTEYSSPTIRALTRRFAVICTNELLSEAPVCRMNKTELQSITGTIGVRAHAHAHTYTSRRDGSAM